MPRDEVVEAALDSRSIVERDECEGTWLRW
jgi:hypothetical protein